MDVLGHTIPLPHQRARRARCVPLYAQSSIVSNRRPLRAVIGHQQINCSPKEIVTLVPPGGLSCGEYLAGYISRKGGYLLDAASTSACQFCSTRTTDEFLSARFHIKYSEHWWYMGEYHRFKIGSPAP